MKVTNICRKLAQTLAAAGLFAVSSADAAPLNTNLVVNPSFESVDPSILVTEPPDSAVLVTGGWTALVGGGGVGAYTYSQGFDNGPDPPGSGSYYYTFPANPSPATQVIDLSAGDSASLIATGNALFSASSYFSNYLSQGDYGRLTVTFKNSGGTTLGSPVVLNSNAGLSGGVLNWSQFSTDGTVPVGTATATVELVGIRFDGTTNLRFREGYFDLVDFRVLNAPPPVGLTLTVNRANGNLTIGTEASGSPVNITEYSVESVFGGLAPANWLSIADNYDAGNPGPNQVDSNSNWVEVTDPAANDNLNEEDSNPNGATLTVGRTINLGNAWLKSYEEDLVFRYTTNGQVLTGAVSYSGNGGQPFEYGDLNFNGSIGPEDYLILANNQHVDLTGNSFAEAYQLGDLTGNLANNHVDFVEFKTLYTQANGAGSFEAMLASIPEPSSSAMVVVAGLFGLLIKRRTARDGVS